VANIRYKERRQLLQDSVDRPLQKMSAMLVAMMDAKLEEHEFEAKAETFESDRELLKYQDNPEKFALEFLEVPKSDPAMVYYRIFTHSTKRVSRQEVSSPDVFKAAVMAVFWFYKTRENANVFIRLKGCEIKWCFWDAYRKLKNSTEHRIVQEELNSPFGKSVQHGLQRRKGSFITETVPWAKFSENVMFVFSGGWDWNHDDCRKIHLTGDVDSSQYAIPPSCRRKEVLGT